MLAVIRNRMALCLQDSMGIEMRTILWTDSHIVLHWIKGPTSRWNTFVANKVAEIQAAHEWLYWKHCPGAYNPVDIC